MLFRVSGVLLPVCVAVNNQSPRILFFLLDITALACVVGRGERQTRILLPVPLGDGLDAQSANYQAALLKRNVVQANTPPKLVSGCLWAKAVECAVLFVSRTLDRLVISVVETFGKQPVVSSPLCCLPSLPLLRGSIQWQPPPSFGRSSPAWFCNLAAPSSHLNELRKDPMHTGPPSWEVEGRELSWAGVLEPEHTNVPSPDGLKHWLLRPQIPAPFPRLFPLACRN